jgi:hypothetical protein
MVPDDDDAQADATWQAVRTFSSTYSYTEVWEW